MAVMLKVHVTGVLEIVLTVVLMDVVMAIVVNNVVHITIVVVVTAVRRVVTAIVIVLVLEVALVNVDLLFVKVTATPVVLVPPIQAIKYLLFYSFFNTIYSNISLLYRSFIWQELYFVYTQL